MKTHRICCRCRKAVVLETKIKEYPFYCQTCDENMYRFETENAKKNKRSRKMTVEELKNKLISEAQDGWNKLNITKRVCGSEFSYYDGYIDCGFIKEEQIRALQKQNGELTDELKTLHESIKDYGAGCYENGLRNGKRKLEEQLTKAKDLLKRCYENYIYLEPLRSEIEQFLSEVEK